MNRKEVGLFASLMLAFALAFAPAAVMTGCGSDDSAAEGDSAAVVAEGSMESDAENFGEEDEEETGEKEESDKPKKKKERSTSVQASPAFRGDLVMPVFAEGTIRARHEAEMRTEIAGRIARVYAQEGDRVRRGSLIVKLDDRELAVALEEARASYLRALSLLTIEGDEIDFQEMAEEVREEFSNLERLEKRGEITREERVAREIELDIESLKGGKFRTEIAAARSGVSEARAALERARINLERTEIRAPFDGVITGLTLSAGQYLNTNETVCSLVDVVNIEAEVGVLEADLGFVSHGKPVLLAVPALGETLRVQVDVVSPQFDRESRTCQVLLRVKNDDGAVMPGMFVRALIAGETLNDRLLVPREAILTREGRPLLFKVEDGRAKWLYVDVGEANEDLVEIKRVVQGGNLEPGDKVVVSDHLTLAHEAKIKIKKTVGSGDPWVSFSRVDE